MRYAHPHSSQPLIARPLLAVALIALPLAAMPVNAQTQPPAQEAPQAVQPAPAQPQASTPPTAQPPAAKADTKPFVGMQVMASDDADVGPVVDVRMGPDGKPTAILLRTGGFLGFGTRLVAIPFEKVTEEGKMLRVGLTEAEIEALPEAERG